MASKEQTRVAQVACSLLSATSSDQTLERIEIINNARQELEAPIFEGSAGVIDRYLRFGTCVDFILEEDAARYKTEQRDEAFRQIVEVHESGDEMSFVFDLLTDGGSYLFHLVKRLDNGDRVPMFVDAMTMLQLTDGHLEGIIHQQDDEGWYGELERLKFSATLVDGRLEGEFKLRFENDQMFSSITYLKNKKNGIESTWHANGQLAAEYKFVDGVLQGAGRSWRDDGSRRYEGVFKDGELTSFKSFDNDGRVDQFTRYTDEGKRDGFQYLFGDWSCYHNGEKAKLSQCEGEVPSL